MMGYMDKNVRQTVGETSTTAQQPARRLSSSELFGNDRQILIQHGVSEYLLRITRQGKLILTK